MNKYDIVRNYCRFECEPGIEIVIDYVSSGQQDVDEANVRFLEAKWKDVWPATFALLKEMRIRYRFDPDINPAGMRAKLMLANNVVSETSSWEVSFTVEKDGYSEWGVAFNGSTIDRSSSQPYF
jgi:hypothetical protein